MTEKDDAAEFLHKLGMKDGQHSEPALNMWDSVIVPESSYLILGDRRMGKSALAYWLLEAYSRKYDLFPITVGLPREKHHLLPANFVTKDSPEDCVDMDDVIIFIDEAGLQLPIEDTKAREYMVNFLSLPGHRNQILLLAFHFPKLVLMRYLPFLDAFLLKRPPYLLEFAGKRQNDALTQMMLRAEERFGEFATTEEVRSHTYVVAPRLRWQGMLENPLCSFWQDDLSKVWAGTRLEPKQKQPQQPELQIGDYPRMATKGWRADDPDKKAVHPVTADMIRRARVVEEHPFQNSCYVTMQADGIRWVKKVY